MRKKLLALLLAAALALSLLAGCGGGESVASALLKLLEGRYPNISIEIDPDLEADLRQAIRKAEAENAGDDDAVIRAALEKLVGYTVTFRNLGEGQQGDTTFDLVFYAGSDPGKAAQAAYSQWNPILSNVPDDGKYDTSLAMVETNSGVWMLVKATVEKAGTVDKPDPEPVKTSITVANDMLGDLNNILRNNPSITTVNFSGITDKIPAGVLSGTNVSKIIVSTTTNVENAFSGVSGLTIEVTAPDTGTGGTVNSSILGGASGVTLDLSRSGITYIGVDAFYSCTGLTSVTLPEGLTTIERYAFYGCTGLTSVDLRSCTGLERIEEEAFYGCTGLTSIDLNDCTGLTDIGEGAFDGCTGLASVDLSSCTGLTYIGMSAFDGCDILSQVTLPSHGEVLRIGPYAFAVDSGPQPLHLRIPNQKMTLSLMTFSFSNRKVTVYCDLMKADGIASDIETCGRGKVVGKYPYAPAP